ncbi:hypothetical protein [Streptomyces sp. NBC_01439]|uniref:hypothetical protein n=1 Tax=Streptomyces sp. NBC_01439 TaxID=2903867 RepID=UPI002E2ADB63|nr:hypothetical protein [Streptomyces sp. NBC_01439]
MDDPVTGAANQYEDRRRTPDSIAPDEPNAPPVRTLPLPDVGQDALRAAAETGPVQDVRRMVALLGESPHEAAGADLTPHAAAVGRSIEDVALLVTILGKEDAAEAERRGRAGPAGPADPYALPSGSHTEPSTEPSTQHSTQHSSTRSAKHSAESYEEGREEPFESRYPEPYDGPYQEPPRRAGRVTPRAAPAAPRAASRDRALRRVLRWPVAIALLGSGALHLPIDLTALQFAAPVDYLPLVVTVLCLVSGALVALRDTRAVWRAGAATALGVVALHVLGGSLRYDPLAGSVGGTPAWAGATVVLCAAIGAVLAGLALRNRREPPA